MIKLIVSDIDGTLMDRSKAIRREDIDALRVASRSGIRLCLASGRMRGEIESVRTQLDELVFAICQNGASVVAPDGRILAENAYVAKLALAVLDMVGDTGLVVVVCTAEANRVARLDAEAERVGARFLTPLRVEPDLREAVGAGMKVTKFSVYGEVRRLQRLLFELGAAFGAAVTATFSDPDGVDVMPGGVDKGAGIKLLMNELGLQPREVACIGDSFNDLAMFETVPNSYAMAHADEDVRKRAAYVVPGVSEAIADMRVRKSSS